MGEKFGRLLRVLRPGTHDARREVTSFSGLAPIRLQTLPEQKNRPSAQASTRSESGPFMAMVA